MQRVTGLGGFFFEAADPDGLAEWYERHLGVARTPTSYDGQAWIQERGAAVFQPFPRGTAMLAGRAYMLNFRVTDLDAMAAQLRAGGVAVELDAETYPNGRFASLADPEGNPIQLWEPEAGD